MSRITVRQAVFADSEALAPLFDAYRRFYKQPPDLDAAKAFLHDRFDHGESVLFLASNAEVPVGFTQLYPSFSSVALARTFILNDLFVAEGWRRKGVASKLLGAATEYARSLGAVRVTLTTDVGNSTAQATYDAQGWKRDEQFCVYHFAVAR